MSWMRQIKLSCFHNSSNYLWDGMRGGSIKTECLWLFNSIHFELRYLNQSEKRIKHFSKGSKLIWQVVHELRLFVAEDNYYLRCSPLHDVLASSEILCLYSIWIYSLKGMQIINSLFVCFMENWLSDRHDGILHDSFTLSHVPGQSVIFSCSCVLCFCIPGNARNLEIIDFV